MQATKMQTVASSSSSRKAVHACPPRISRSHNVNVRAQSGASSTDEAALANRRQLLLASSGLVLSGLASSQGLIANAEEASYATFLGYATPPTSYGGYGGNAAEDPKYTFEYPNGWKAEVPSKVEKGTQGIDGRVVNPRVKGQRAFVITLGRAGEDNKSFRLTDLDSTFQGFAGADYDLQDAISGANDISTTKKDVDGEAFYIYDIDSPETRYLASISVKNGKVFALFVKSPAKAFRTSEAKLRHIIDSFRLL